MDIFWLQDCSLKNLKSISKVLMISCSVLSVFILTALVIWLSRLDFPGEAANGPCRFLRCRILVGRFESSPSPSPGVFRRASAQYRGCGCRSISFIPFCTLTIPSCRRLHRARGAGAGVQADPLPASAACREQGQPPQVFRLHPVFFLTKLLSLDLA